MSYSNDNQLELFNDWALLGLQSREVLSQLEKRRGCSFTKTTPAPRPVRGARYTQAELGSGFRLRYRRV